MVVMIEASTHTIQLLWMRARLLSQGDDLCRNYGAGMQEVLRELGAPSTQTEASTLVHDGGDRG